MDELLTEIQKLNIGIVKSNERLSHHTTMKIGGPADIFIEPSSIESIQKVMSFIKDHQLPWRVIGRGSNLLVSDKGIEGVVIKLGAGLNHLSIHDSTITVGGGHSLVSLSTLISKKGLSGLEFASGIPGSVGGEVYMN
ncbi:FAD-binding protein, partial [Neobacillus vireti]|uniref:FAD-binding protein n=1 Tax=Neobacillus vireti TaxID=220686 RepID=UPI00300019C3